MKTKTFSHSVLLIKWKQSWETLDSIKKTYFDLEKNSLMC